MKKRFIKLLSAFTALLMLCVSLSSCGDENHNAIDNSPESTVNGDSKVLVAYFSWSGNEQQMARWISEETGGDLFRIVPAEPYGEDFNSCADRAKNELDNETRPELSEHIDADTMAQYDVIYLGFPVWWYDLPMPVLTFLEEYDLSGKTIIPFNTHGGSGFSNTINTIKKLEPEATVNENGFTVSRNSVQEAEPDIISWLKELGYVQ